MCNIFGRWIEFHRLLGIAPLKRITIEDDMNGMWNVCLISNIV